MERLSKKMALWIIKNNPESKESYEIRELSKQSVDELWAVKGFMVRLPFYYADKSRRIQEV